MTGAVEPLSTSQLRALGVMLLAWYRRHKRELPWRETSDPYRIWVSEIMLQQTQVNTVVPYYRRFLERFPTLDALAAADLDEVLALWQGLGYYARARNLHRAAQALVAQGRESLPRDLAELRALPGIGDYTAGAIRAIGYGEDEPAVDANIARILARLSDFDGDPKAASARRVFRNHLVAMMPTGGARDTLQALMDLGSAICTSRSPQCLLCPLAQGCLAKARGVQEDRPVRTKRPPRPHRHVALGILRCRDRVLIARRKPSGLLGGLWELPGCMVHERQRHVEALCSALEDRLAIAVEPGEAVGAIEHAYSHFGLSAALFSCRWQGEPTASGEWDAVHWLRPQDLPDYGLTGLTTKALSAIDWPGSRDASDTL